jgi:hypothetical protein
MTTENDDLRDRILQFGEGLTLTQGISSFGFQDPVGEFPRNQYINQPSLNFGAVGRGRHNLSFGGAADDLSVNLDQPSTSNYSQIQVRETPSGHVLEFDDTFGAERILIKHRDGSGLELRADGSVLLVSRNNKIETVAGTNTVVIEGNCDLNYKGDLNLKVSGDYNLDVGGDMNVKVGGNGFEKVRGNKRIFVRGNRGNITKGSVSNTVVGAVVNTQLGGASTSTKGTFRNTVEGEVLFSSSADTIFTSESEIIQSSPNINIGAQSLTVVGDTGTIGGQNIISYAYNYHAEKTFWGETIKLSRAGYAKTWHGDLNGTSRKALVAGGLSIVRGLRIDGTSPDTKATALPTYSLMNSWLTKSTKGVRIVKIDINDDIKKMIDRSADNGGVTDRTLTTPEVVTRMKNPANVENQKFINTQISEGKLSPSYAQTQAGSVSSAETTGARPGRRPLGNNADRSKRFEAPEPTVVTFTPDPRYNPVGASQILAGTRLGPHVTMSKFLGSSNDRISLSSYTAPQRAEMAKNLFVHASFMRSIIEDTGAFKDYRLVVEEGIYKPEPEEVITPDSLADTARLGRTIVYTLYDSQGKRAPNSKVFDLAQHWKGFTYYEKIMMDYHTFDPKDGSVKARVIITIPEIDDTYQGNYSRLKETRFNGKKQASELLLIEG